MPHSWGSLLLGFTFPICTFPAAMLEQELCLEAPLPADLRGVLTSLETERDSGKNKTQFVWMALPSPALTSPPPGSRLGPESPAHSRFSPVGEGFRARCRQHWPQLADVKG